MASHTEVPPRVSRWLERSAVLVLAVAIIGIGLISVGLFDPKPVGRLSASLPLNQLAVAAGRHRLIWLDPALPNGDYSLRLSAAYRAGEDDIGYGVVVGDDQAHVTVAVSPLGYAAIWQGSGRAGPTQEAAHPGTQLDLLAASGDPILPWQTWPHVRLGQEPNELWLDVRQELLTSVRVNRELLWQATSVVHGRNVGLWLESFGNPTLVDFQKLELFWDSRDQAN